MSIALLFRRARVLILFTEKFRRETQFRREKLSASRTMVEIIFFKYGCHIIEFKFKICMNKPWAPCRHYGR